MTACKLRHGYRLLAACSWAALSALHTSPAPAAAAAATAAGAAAAPEPPSSDLTQPIIVTAPSLFPDIQPERQLDEQGIESYGVSTVDELLGEVEGEIGEDEEPLIVVNGQRLNDVSEIGGLPVEALRNLQVLPRGSAVRLGGTSGQRVISLTLTHKLRSATLTGAEKLATEGGWNSSRGEALLTHVQGQTRANIALRARGDGSLFESERDIIQPAPRLPYALGGNVIAFPTSLAAEIDPLLSAAAGQTVTVAPIPSGTHPVLADFVTGANQAAVTSLGEFRTLRPNTRNYDLNATFATQLTPWLTGNASFRLDRNLTRSERGLPPVLFVLPRTNAFSPFSRDVGLAYYGAQPLHSRGRNDSGDANLTLDGNFGQWTSNFNARHIQSTNENRTDRSAVGGTIRLADNVNPFGGTLPGLITISTARTVSRALTDFVQLSGTGPALKLPAGDVQTTIEGRLESNRVHSSGNLFGPPTSGFSRSDQLLRGAVEIPLTSRDNNFIRSVGNLTATAEYTRVHYSDAGNLSDSAFGLTWEPLPMLRLEADTKRTQNPALAILLAGPIITTPGIRMFDPLTSETVDVTLITGGNPALAPETDRVRRISGILKLVPRLNLQLNGEYTDTSSRNFISGLPEASAAVMLAFPDRFIRNSSGTLTTVDLRPVNFDMHREKRLRYGVSLAMRLSRTGLAASRSGGVLRASGPQTRFDFTLNHNIVFSDTIMIRPGLGAVNLLGGGAIGIAGGRVRHQLDGTASLTSGGLGIKVGGTWRGPSTLLTRFGGTTTDTLHFSPLVQLNIRAFADAGRLFGRSALTHSTRLSLNVLNATGDRQEVIDSQGFTPIQYQPAYRDPIGRTVEFEIRKVF